MLTKKYYVENSIFNARGEKVFKEGEIVDVEINETYVSNFVMISPPISMSGLVRKSTPRAIKMSIGHKVSKDDKVVYLKKIDIDKNLRPTIV